MNFMAQEYMARDHMADGHMADGHMADGHMADGYAANTEAHAKPSDDLPRAADLAPEEEGVAAWFRALERVDPPASLRHRVLAASARRPSRSGTLLRAFPLGAWGLATAATLLLAVGAIVAVELTTPAPELPGPRRAAGPAVSLIVESDPTLALFHGLETFDEVGLAPGELIADWGR
jgi:hypothetical protein